MGVSTACEDLASVPALLDRLLRSPASTPGAYASDGQAAHRVARVIAQALALPLH